MGAATPPWKGGEWFAVTEGTFFHTPSKIKTCIKGDRPGARCGSDATEVCGIDICVRIIPLRRVQHIHCISPNSEGLRLADSNPLTDCQIKIDARWAHKETHGRSP